MKRFDIHWEPFRLSLAAGNLRLGLALISLAALVLGGNAGDHWA